MTPEGRIKKLVKDVLNVYGCYRFMPVQTGFGAAGLDFHCIVRCRNMPLAFFVETKKDEMTDLTPRQELLKNTLEVKYNAKVFVVGGPQSLKQLSTWLEARYLENGRAVATNNPERVHVSDE